MKVRAMKFAYLAAGRVRRPLRRFLRDKRGVSAVEFAMLLPLMITLYIGGVEVSSAIAVDRKVTLVARTLGDLVAQSTSVNSADMTNILNAASSVVQPYSPSLIKVTVSRVDVDANSVAKVVWSKTKNGTARAPNSVVTLDNALKTANTSLIWAESQYGYTPTMGYVITGTLQLKDQIYMRPRLSDAVTCNAC
ncbi:MAG TPA: TadE/TadG family type IV pilus assembly protein [Steroidobacter sp.]